MNLKKFFFQDKSTKLLLIFGLLAFFGAVIKFFFGNEFIAYYSFLSLVIFIFAMFNQIVLLVKIVFLAGFLIMILLLIPFIEALTMKPLIYKYDCRIVNTAEAIKQGKELRLYFKDGIELTHIVALNEDGTIIDKSYSEKGINDNGKKIGDIESIEGVKLAYKKTVDGKEMTYINNAKAYIQIKYINSFSYFYKRINY
ncbi:hypothetical protein L5F64_00210 [Aliarcobacter butzleri]|uniref:hypothetical protein n=1 Tax=Aliarcobacter butzleri TaxID=28197 RepID=UPI001EDC74C4|nr:hypothetical protein [Aliarcobacter butzleri]MCG3711531.1 hypothetical protein [Aliarcobacter butzleri]MCG3713982.1 hypothetical protein [Aliarcobacter butzleri]